MESFKFLVIVSYCKRERERDLSLYAFLCRCPSDIHYERDKHILSTKTKHKLPLHLNKDPLFREVLFMEQLQIKGNQYMFCFGKSN